MRILWVSVAPWVGSGYGTQTGIWTQQLQKLGHDVAIFAYRGLIGTTTQWNGMPVFPQGRMTTFGLETIPFWYDQHQADVCIYLSDLFVWTEYRAALAASDVRFVPWMPIDAEPLGAPDHNILKTLTGSGRTRPMAMSRHGKKMLADAGYGDALFCPHAVDTDVFLAPAPDQRIAAREQFGLTMDTFIAGMCAANESSDDRKAFGEQFQAFANFAERHPDSLLLVHAVKNRHPVGLDLESMCRRLGIEDKVLFADEMLYNSGGYTPEMLRDQFYALLDVYLGASKAEGFGVPLIEAQACGVPCIATDASAMAENTAKGLAGGYRVDGQKIWSSLHASWWATPRADHIEDGLESFFHERRKGTISECREAARGFALDFSIAQVTEKYMIPALSQIQEWIT